MNKNDERYLRYAGVAKLIYNDIAWAIHVSSLSEYAKEELEAHLRCTIAGRIWDWTAHIIDHAPASVSDADDWHIPDLTAWPEEA